MEGLTSRFAANYARSASKQLVLFDDPGDSPYLRPKTFFGQFRSHAKSRRRKAWSATTSGFRASSSRMNFVCSDT